MWLVDKRSNPNDFSELTEGAFARLVCGPRRFLPRPHVLEIHVTHAAPAYRAEYDRIFQCPVVFESRWNAMHMEKSLATHRVALQPRYVFGVLSERNLKAEGVTFEQVLDELRHKMALHYLNGKKASVNETAYLVGFSDPTAFSRAFKRWTGTSPSTMRTTQR